MCAGPARARHTFPPSPIGLVVGFLRVRRHSHRRARSTPRCGVSRGPRAYRVRVPIVLGRTAIRWRLVKRSRLNNRPEILQDFRVASFEKPLDLALAKQAFEEPRCDD